MKVYVARMSCFLSCLLLCHVLTLCRILWSFCLHSCTCLLCLLSHLQVYSRQLLHLILFFCHLLIYQSVPTARWGRWGGSPFRDWGPEVGGVEKMLRVWTPQDISHCCLPPCESGSQGCVCTLVYVCVCMRVCVCVHVRLCACVCHRLPVNPYITPSSPLCFQVCGSKPVIWQPFPSCQAELWWGGWRQWWEKEDGQWELHTAAVAAALDIAVSDYCIVWTHSALTAVHTSVLTAWIHLYTLAKWLILPT